MLNYDSCYRFLQDLKQYRKNGSFDGLFCDRENEFFAEKHLTSQNCSAAGYKVMPMNQIIDEMQLNYSRENFKNHEIDLAFSVGYCYLQQQGMIEHINNVYGTRFSCAMCLMHVMAKMDEKKQDVRFHPLCIYLTDTILSMWGTDDTTASELLKAAEEDEPIK